MTQTYGTFEISSVFEISGRTGICHTRETVGLKIVTGRTGTAVCSGALTLGTFCITALTGIVGSGNILEFPRAAFWETVVGKKMDSVSVY